MQLNKSFFITISLWHFQLDNKIIEVVQERFIPKTQDAYINVYGGQLHSVTVSRKFWHCHIFSATIHRSVYVWELQVQELMEMCCTSHIFSSIG